MSTDLETMQHRLSWLFAFSLLILLPASICFAQDEIAVETISGKKFSGKLQRIESDGVLVGDGFEGVNIEQVLSISTGRKSNPPVAGKVKLRLVDGGLLHVSSPGVDGETINFAPTSTGIASMSMQSVGAIVFRESDLIREAVSQPATDQDTVVVDQGKSLAKVSGVLESLTAEQLQLNFKGKSRPIKLEKVAAVVIADLGLNPPQGSLATLGLTDGSTLRGALAGFGEQEISIELTGKQIVKVNRKHLVRIDIESDSIAYLSSLEPLEAQQQPQFTVARPWQRNLSVEGNPIRLLVNTTGAADSKGDAEIKTFENGIGTSSYSRLVFENTKEFSRFLATAGIDAETEGRGDCEMRVEGDGITLWSKRIRGGDTAVEIDVDISGIREVALVVDPGEQFDLADHAEWARARFLKTQ